MRIAYSSERGLIVHWKRAGGCKYVQSDFDSRGKELVQDNHLLKGFKTRKSGQ